MMTVKVLHAGDGYTYLTRQVASGDAVRANGEGLADYYAASGNPPGRWLGEGLDDLGVSGLVSEEQMRALFGERLHPDADRIQAELIASGATADEALAATQLGRKLPTFTNADDHFDNKVKQAFARFERQYGRRPEAGVEADLVRWNVADRHLAQRAGGQAPTDKEIRNFFALRGSKMRQPVSGYDLVFTPSKSVSVLWGLGDRDVSRAIEQVHDRAVRETVSWLEGHAAVTRSGAGGIRQERAKGFIAAAFDHIDSRAGDPNLHTHVAIANVVKGADGKWKALDARPLHSYTVAASEHYNALVEQYVSQQLPSVHFENRVLRRGAQPVREIVGVDHDLIDLYSKRSAQIRDRVQDKVVAYEARHGVKPSKSTQIRLAQEANLATRAAKVEGVTLLERRQQWKAEVAQLPASAARLKQLERLALRDLRAEAVAAVAVLTPTQADALAAHVIHSLEDRRSRWHGGHVEAEVRRSMREVLADSPDGAEIRAAIPGLEDAPTFRELASAETTANGVARRAVGNHSLSLEAPDVVERPALLTRLDGPGRDDPTSLYRVHGKRWYSSMGVLDREDALVNAGAITAGPRFDAGDVALVARANGLTDSQTAVAVRFAGSGRLVDAAIGPAGSGKTTTMRAFVRGVEINRGRVVGLAPSAVAAEVLGNELSTPAETVAKFLDVHRRGQAHDAHPLRVDATTIILVDEAGMTSTKDLSDVLAIVQAHGASLRLIGDPSQLGAVEGGGALRLFDRVHGAERLSDIHRFVDPAEAAATLQIRDGDTDAVQHYIDHGRLVGGRRDELLEQIYANWRRDNAAGEIAVMVSSLNDDVLQLNQRAQGDRVAAGEVHLTGRTLHDSSTVGIGDRIVTRENDRQLRLRDGSFVKNGDRWIVTAVKDDGSLRVVREGPGEAHELPSAYVDRNVELGYAATIHRVQGMTVAHSHVLVTDEMTRELLYVGLSRGYLTNCAYVETHTLLDVDGHSPVPDNDSPAAIFRTVVAREGAELSARETIEHELARATSLDTLLSHYEDVQTTFAPAVDELATRDRLERALGSHAHYLDGDPHLAAIGRRLDRLERTGVDLVPMLRDRVPTWELSTDPEPGRLVLERLATPGPGARVGVPEIDEWLTSMEAVIRDGLADPVALGALPRGMDPDTVRHAWGVRPSDHPAPEPLLEMPLDEVLARYELALVGAPRDMAVEAERALAVMVDAYGPAATRLPEDTDHWPSLVNRLGALERTGVDVPTVARMRVVPAALEVAAEPAAHVLERIGEPGPAPTASDPRGHVAALERTVRARLADPDAIAPAGRDLAALRAAWHVAPDDAAPIGGKDSPRTRTARKGRAVDEGGPDVGGISAAGAHARQAWSILEQLGEADERRPPRL